MSESKKAFWNGVKAEIPLLIGVFPFGMIYGALALNAGLSALACGLYLVKVEYPENYFEKKKNSF